MSLVVWWAGLTMEEGHIFTWLFFFVFVAVVVGIAILICFLYERRLRIDTKEGNNMKKIISIILAFVLTLCMVACRPSERVSYNVSKEADSFGVMRKLTVINCRTDSIMMELVGTFSMGNSDAGELEIICKTGDDSYKKHYVYLNEWTAYTVEDISGADVDPFSYEINFYPKMFDLVDVDVKNNVGNPESGFGG